MELLQQIVQTFPIIERFFDKTSLKTFLSCPFDDLFFYHFSLGTQIRNELLEVGSPLHALFLKSNISTCDNMSHLIIELFYIHMQLKA